MDKVTRRNYPFTAIVGQEEMKLALLLNVVDPLIGGVLIMGHRGTGKSTAVRALADLLPQIAGALSEDLNVFVVPTPPEIAATYGVPDAACSVPRDMVNWRCAP